MPVQPEGLRKLNDPQVTVDFKALERVARKFKLDLIVMHGSRAQGYSHSKSDLDIAVRTRRTDYQKRSSQREAEWYLRLIGEINEAIDCPPDGCDVRLLNPSDSLFLMNVAKYGIPLYEEDSTTFTEFAIAAARCYEDGKPMRQQLREAQRERLYGRTATRDH